MRREKNILGHDWILRVWIQKDKIITIVRTWSNELGFRIKLKMTKIETERRVAY